MESVLGKNSIGASTKDQLSSGEREEGVRVSFLSRDPHLTMRNAPMNRKKGSSEAQAPIDNQRPNSRLRDGTGLCLSVYLSASVPLPNPKQPSQAPGPSYDQCCPRPTYIFPICRPLPPSLSPLAPGRLRSSAQSLGAPYDIPYSTHSALP